MNVPASINLEEDVNGVVIEAICELVGTLDFVDTQVTNGAATG